MKTSLLALLLAGAALTAFPSPTAIADDGTTSGQAALSGNSTNSGDNSAPAGAQGRRLERLKQVLAGLDLTDAQKEQIKQIRCTVTDRRERRLEILGVLTPDQKAKLREMILASRNGN